MKFPPQIDPSTGRFKVSSQLDNVKESVYIILMTQLGERWLRPHFGSNIMSFTFADITATTLNVMRSDIRSAILTNEPRITNVEVDMTEEARDGRLVVTVDYYVAGQYTPNSLVFPFYINGDREVTEDESEL